MRKTKACLLTEKLRPLTPQEEKVFLSYYLKALILALREQGLLTEIQCTQAIHRLQGENSIT